MHPQRSVITRALGTDPAVDVDSYSVEARARRLFLLCSDGLTTMLGEATSSHVAAPGRSTRPRGLSWARRTRAAERTTSPSCCSARRGRARTRTRSSGPGLPLEQRPGRRAGASSDTGEPATDRPRSRSRWQRGRKAPRPKRRRRGRRGAGLSPALASRSLRRNRERSAVGLSRAHFVGADEEGKRRRLPGRSLGTCSPAAPKLYRETYVSRLQAVAALAGRARAARSTTSSIGEDQARARDRRYEAGGGALAAVSLRNRELVNLDSGSGS